MKETNEVMKMEMLIKELGVFELRGVARQLGVPSPTTKKRDELIDLITEAIKNGASLSNSIPKRGRPYKKLNVLDSITNKINNEVLKIDFSANRNYFNFAQNESEDLVDYIFEGIVHKYNTGIEMYDIKTGARARIERTELLNELLEVGDKIKASVRYNEGIYVVDKIMFINGEDFNSYRSKFVNKEYAVISNDEIPFAQTMATVGRRNLYKLENELFETDNLEKLLNFCNKKGYVLIVLAVNTSFENEIMLEKLACENKFVSAYGTDNEMNYHKIMSAINYAENLVDRGNKVVLFTADIVEIIKCLNKFFAKEINNSENHEETTLLVIQKLLKFARAYNYGCSGTLILCYDEVDSNNNFFVNDIFKISKKLN